MSLKSKIKGGFLSILLWSVISAAYIGPGSVTVAAQAGLDFGYSLLWSVLYSTFACLLLQEAAARLSIVSGMNLGEAIVVEFEDSATKILLYVLIISAIVVGCAAYQTGNISGAVVGLKLLIPDPGHPILGLSFPQVLAIGTALLAFIFLNAPSMKWLANVLGIMVLLMTVAFIPVAYSLKPSIIETLKGTLIPSIPYSSDGSLLNGGLLVLGMIGTTVVPYDLFLGSGVMGKQGQTLGEMRFGLSVAVILGGIITGAILLVGIFVDKAEYVQMKAQGKDLYDILSVTLQHHFHGQLWPKYFFGAGLFSASIATTITAPIASAITAQSLFISKNPVKWRTQGPYFKATWLFVLLAGLGFVVSGVEPVFAIIMAQALNGLILPFIAIFLLFVVNNPKVMGDKINGWGSNILLSVCICVCLIVGAIMVTRTLSEAWNYALSKGLTSFVIISLISVFITSWLVFLIHKKRKKGIDTNKK